MRFYLEVKIINALRLIKLVWNFYKNENENKQKNNLIHPYDQSEYERARK